MSSAKSDVIIRATSIEIVDPKSLKPHPKNPNQHSAAQIDALVALYKYQGMRIPLVISNLSGYTISGHGRTDAAIKAGCLVPVMFQDFDSEEQEYAFMVSDNAVALQAELNMAQINMEVPNLGPDFDIAMLGIPDFKIDVSELPDLPTSDRNALRQMAFQLTEEQQHTVERALKICKKMGGFEDTGSSNSNGNALTRMAEIFTTQNQNYEDN